MIDLLSLSELAGLFLKSKEILWKKKRKAKARKRKIKKIIKKKKRGSEKRKSAAKRTRDETQENRQYKAGQTGRKTDGWVKPLETSWLEDISEKGLEWNGCGIWMWMDVDSRDWRAVKEGGWEIEKEFIRCGGTLRHSQSGRTKESGKDSRPMRKVRNLSFCRQSKNTCSVMSVLGNFCEWIEVAGGGRQVGARGGQPSQQLGAV